MRATEHFPCASCHAADPRRPAPMDEPRGYRDSAGPPAGVDISPAGGRTLHAEPHEESAQVGRLIPPSPGPGRVRSGGARPSFPLLASFDGWLLLRRGNGSAGRDAWILGPGISTGVSVARGYSHPSLSSQIVIRSRDGALLDAHAELIDIIGCDGGWIFGRWRIDEADKLSWRQELTIWSNPPVVEFWTPACDRRARGCDTPPRSRPAHACPRNPIPHDEPE